MILDKERAAAVAHARSLSRDVDIFSEKEREWARQANARNVENKALASRVRDLEQKVASERAEKEMLKATLTSAHGKEVGRRRWCNTPARCLQQWSHHRRGPVLLLLMCRRRTCGWSWRACAR